MTFLTEIVPLYNDQVEVFLVMTTSLSSIYLILQYINKMWQRELNPGIKDFDEKIPIIANLTFSLVIALFNPQNLNAQQRYRAAISATTTSNHLPTPLFPSQNIHHGDTGDDHPTDGV